MSIYKDGKLIAGGRQCLPLLSFMWADHVLNDASWLRADTYSWQSGAVYQAAYQHLADDIDGKTLHSETISGTTIQFYLADDGHKICPASEESNVTAIYNATGVAWYYIIDTANTKFKLPRINKDKELLNISAPVITADTQMNTNGMPTLKFKTTSNGNPGGGGVAVDGSNNFIRTNQSLGTNKGNLVPSNLIANLSNATGLYKGKQYLYFYVGNFTQTALENTAGIVTEDFNELNAHKVIAFQEPTAANNYTWYRKYADGWVEQGCNNPGTFGTVTLLIEMADSNYSITITPSDTYYVPRITARSATSFSSNGRNIDNSNLSGNTSFVAWQVSGKSAN